jgi:hypothetical protein
MISPLSTAGDRDYSQVKSVAAKQKREYRLGCPLPYHA